MDSDECFVVPHGVRKWFGRDSSTEESRGDEDYETVVDREERPEEIIASLEQRIEAAVHRSRMPDDDELHGIAENYRETIRRQASSPD